LQSLHLEGSIFKIAEFKYVKQYLPERLSSISLRTNEFIYNPEVVRYERTKIFPKISQNKEVVDIVIIDDKPIKNMKEMIFYTNMQ
jgi:hypothetical protein